MPGKRRGSLSKRSPAEWGIRGVVAALAAIAGYASVTAALAEVVVKADPAIAHVLAPWNGHITADLAEQRFTLEPQSGPESEAARLARLALRQDPTAVEAFSVLGLQAQLRNDTGEARQLFTYSQTLSQRELRPRIWAIEEAVSRGDIAGALEQYDIALRTSRSARDILYPVLASAISEPKVRSALIEMMARGSVWDDSFVNFVATRAPDPHAAVRFFREGERANLPIDEADRTRVVNALVARELFDDAWRYYTSFRPGADRSRSRDASFSLPAEASAVFDWRAINSSGLSASIQQDEGGGMLDFAASPSTGGTALRQVQLLPPGTYRLEGHSIGIEQPERSLPYWTLTCPGGRELGRVTVSNSAQANGNFSGRFTVPSDCPTQTLSLVVRSSSEIAGVSGQVDRAELVPVG